MANANDAGHETEAKINMDDQTKHYGDKLEFEIDAWDLRAALDKGERIVIVDARSPRRVKELIGGLEWWK